MPFSQLRDELVAVRKRVDQLERAASREWVMPDMTLVTVRVWPDHDGEKDTTNISIIPSKWRPSETATTILAGKEYRGGWWDHNCMDPRTMTGQQLGYVLAARLLVERWVSGQLDELPTDFPT